MAETVHISSLVIRSRPEQTSSVVQQIQDIDDAQVAHFDDLGRIVVTLETPGEEGIVKAMAALHEINGVVSAALTYHQTDAGDENSKP